MGRCAHLALKAYSLLVFSAIMCRTSWAKVVPFLDPGFFFDYNPPGQPVPIPVTTQCETIHIEWGRSSATGPNPTAPYSLQIYTSTFIVPFLVDAGNALTFDWAVPFVPGTQYQICMFDTNGISGGCQAIYTVIQNTTVPDPTCQNVTFPDSALNILGTVENGPISQYGFVNQCTDISIKPQNGTPPYTLTVAPSLHPPYNITSHSLEAINWTVSLSWASPFFLSLVDSVGNVWANGPMHSGIGSTNCLDTDSISSHHSNRAAVGAGVGGLFGGLVVGLIAASFFWQHKARRCEREMTFIPEKYPTSKTFHKDIEYNLSHPQGSDSPMSPDGLGSVGSPVTMSSAPHSTLRPLQGRDLPSLPLGIPSASATTTNYGSEMDRQRSHAIYVVHHDGGGAPVTVYTGGDADVVELPPEYVEGSSLQRTAAGDSKGVPL